MDMLRDLFPKQPDHALELALQDAAQDLNQAINTLLAAPDEEPRVERVFARREVIEIRSKSNTPDNQLKPEAAREMPPGEDDVVASLHAIFPDACTDFLKSQYKEHHVLHQADIMQFLADRFVENGYTLAERIKKRKLGEPEERGHEDKRARSSPRYSPDEHAPETPSYKRLVYLVLTKEFALMPAQYVRSTFKHYEFLTEAYIHLARADMDAIEHPRTAPCKRLLKPRKVSLTRADWECWDRVHEELDIAKARVRRDLEKVQVEEDKELAVELNEREHVENDAMMECQCCFSDVPFNNMTHCIELHFFCLDCARRNAETELGNSRHKLVCMDGSGCKAEFPQDELHRFLDEKTMKALSKLEQEEALRVADIEGLEECPFCDYAAICEPVEIDKEFRCENPECLEISCRQCRRKTHIPLSCKEAAKDDKINIRHAIEEAMTEAMIRKCNKCKTPFIKDYGCNKMTCTKAGCGAIQCYVCSKTVIGYQHFDDSGRGGISGNCPLFDNHEERHETEVQRAAKAAMENLKAKHPGLDDGDLEIHLSDAVKKREEARRQHAQPAHLRQFPAAAPGIRRHHHHHHHHHVPGPPVAGAALQAPQPVQAARPQWPAVPPQAQEGFGGLPDFYQANYAAAPPLIYPGQPPVAAYGPMGQIGVFNPMYHNYDPENYYF